MKTLVFFIFCLFSAQFGWSQVFNEPGGFETELALYLLDKKIVKDAQKIPPQLTAITLTLYAEEEALSNISADFAILEHEVLGVLDECLDYQTRKNSFAANLLGLEKFHRKKQMLLAVEGHKIWQLKHETSNIFNPENYMTEGKRKILVLNILKRALELTFVDEKNRN